VTAPAPSTDAREIRCPRCGYDQRGVLSTWTESCPLEGVCTECGLRFAWCEILRPEKFEPRWCIEFEPQRRRLPRAAVRTWFRSFVPWLFWSRLKMSDRIRWPRLLAYILLLLVPFLLTYVLVQGGLAAYARTSVQRQLAQMARTRPAAITNLQSLLQQLSAMPPTGDPWQDNQIKAQITGLKAEIARQQAAGAAPDTIDSSWLYTLWEALARPWAGRSRASIVSPSGTLTYPYVAPRELSLLLAQSSGMPAMGVSLEGLVLPLAWLCWGVAMTLLLPLSFVLLPLSMRKAKVRWSHVIRVTIYSLFIPLLMVWLSIVVIVLAVFVQSEGALEMYRSAVRIVPWLALALWWHAATSRYLKIPHAWLTIGMLTLLCLLGLLGVTAAISQQLAWEMLDLFDLLIR